MFATILSWFSSSGALTSIFKTIDTAVDNETAREQIKSTLAQQYLSAQVSLLSGRSWWFPLLFLIPAGLWFSAVCIYSILFCHSCVFPQTWTVVALPHPLDQWMGWIVGSLFVGKAGEGILSRLK